MGRSIPLYTPRLDSAPCCSSFPVIFSFLLPISSPSWPDAIGMRPYTAPIDVDSEPAIWPACDSSKWHARRAYHLFPDYPIRKAPSTYNFIALPIDPRYFQHISSDSNDR
jgi:hypothetical protein